MAHECKCHKRGGQQGASLADGGGPLGGALRAARAALIRAFGGDPARAEALPPPTPGLPIRFYGQPFFKGYAWEKRV